MDAFKEILACIGAAEEVEPALKTALAVAKDFSAHVTAVHVRRDPSCVMPVPVMTADVTGFVVNDVIAAEEDVLIRTADETRRAFDAFVRRENVPADKDGKEAVTMEYRELNGCGNEEIVWLSRVSDLTVLARPDPSVCAEDAFATANAALTESGAAVLVASLTDSPREKFARRIAVVWDASEEAAKTVALSMPFLKRAEEVVLLETAAPDPDLAGVGVLRRRLERHGINASTLIVPETSGGAALGDELIRQTCGGRFDMLAMGAYTQSNMRRWILGSTTRYLLEHADIPLFMAH